MWGVGCFWRLRLPVKCHGGSGPAPGKMLRLRNKVGLEAGFGFGFRKPGFSRKCWHLGRLRLPSIQMLLASASASASLNAVFDGLCFVISFTAGFGLGFRGSIGVLIKPSFTNFVSISIYMQAPFSPPSARLATHAFPLPVERLFSVARKVFRP